MKSIICIALAFFATIAATYELNITMSPSAPFSLELANSSVWYSVAASCGKASYPTRTWSGPSQGFIYKGTIADVETDTQGNLH